MAAVFFIACIILLSSSAAVVNAESYRRNLVTPSPGPSSTGDCASIIYSMATCMPFLSQGNTDTRPDAACCAGFKSVLKVNAGCICEALKSSADMGINLNMTQAMALPSACRVSAPSISQCGIPLPPGAGPVTSPVPSPANCPPTQAPSTRPVSPRPSMAPLSPTSEAAPAPSTVDGGSGATDQTPPPSKKGGACGFSAPSVVIMMSMIAASFYILM